MNDIELTLLTEDQLFGTLKKKRLEVLKKTGTKMRITDLAILTGGYCDTAPNGLDSEISSLLGWGGQRVIMNKV